MQLRSILAASTAALFACSTAAGTPSPVIRTHEGMCDASAVAMVDDMTFVVANDEDNYLRVYGSGAEVLSKVDIYPFLDALPTEEHSEADLEAVARLGETLIWLGSHGRSKKGKARPYRSVLFATRLAGGKLEPVGRVYRGLRAVLAADPKLTLLDLRSVIRDDLPRQRELAPKKRGLNIEGLEVTESGKGVWLALRNPIPDTGAVLIELENPLDVISAGAEPTIGRVEHLDLNGYGFRALAWDESRSGYWMVSGPVAGGGPFRLWQWRPGSPAQPGPALPEGFFAEGIAVRPGGSSILVVSDDGSVENELGDKCKDLPAPEQSFRSLELPLPPTAP